MLEKDKFQFKKSSLIKYTRQLNILIILEALISIQMTIMAKNDKNGFKMFVMVSNCLKMSKRSVICIFLMGHTKN